VDTVELSVLIVDEDLRSRNYLSALLFKKGYNVRTASQGKEGYISALRDHPDAVIFDPAMGDIPAVEFTHKLRTDRRTATALCIALARKEDPAQMADLLAAGCNEYLVKNQENLEKILKLIADLSPQVQETQPAAGVRKRKKRKGGLLCVFLSAKGGTGTSSLCANLATSIYLHKSDASVVVLDSVLPIGSIAGIVGYDGQMNLSTLCALPSETTDETFFRENLPALPAWRFRLVAGTPDPESAGSLQAKRIEQIVSKLQATYDYIFIDIGRSLSNMILPLIQKADVVAIIVSPDKGAIRLTRIVRQYLQEKGLPPNRIYAILNRVVGFEGVTKPEIEGLLSLTMQTTIPHLGGNFSLANDQHIPFAIKFPRDTAAMILKEAALKIITLANHARAETQQRG